MKALAILKIKDNKALVECKYNKFEISVDDLINDVNSGYYFLLNASIFGGIIKYNLYRIREFSASIVKDLFGIILSYNYTASFDKIDIIFKDYKNAVIRFIFSKCETHYLIDGNFNTKEDFKDIVINSIDKTKLSRSNKYKLMGIDYLGTIDNKIKGLCELKSLNIELSAVAQRTLYINRLVYESTIKSLHCKDSSYFLNYINNLCDITEYVLSSKFENDIDRLNIIIKSNKYILNNNLEILNIRLDSMYKNEYIIVLLDKQYVYKAVYTGRYLLNVGTQHNFDDELINDLRNIKIVNFRANKVENLITYNIDINKEFKLIKTLKLLFKKQLSLVDTSSYYNNYYLINKDNIIPFTLELEHYMNKVSIKYLKFYGNSYIDGINIKENIEKDFKESFINKR